MTITLRLPWQRHKPAVPAQFSRIWDGGKPYMLTQVNDELKGDKHTITLIYADEDDLRAAKTAGRAA